MQLAVTVEISRGDASGISGLKGLLHKLESAVAITEQNLARVGRQIEIAIAVEVAAH